MINGFEIKKLKTMRGQDGYIISCDLYYKGFRLGNFFDNGDGSMYNFSPWQEEGRINSFLKNFPKINSGSYALNWDIGILVEELINQKEAKKLIRKTSKNGAAALILVEGLTGGVLLSFYLSIYGDYSNEELQEIAKAECKKNKPNWEFKKATIYKTEKDIDIDFNLNFIP